MTCLKMNSSRSDPGQGEKILMDHKEVREKKFQLIFILMQLGKNYVVSNLLVPSGYNVKSS